MLELENVGYEKKHMSKKGPKFISSMPKENSISSC